MLKHSQDVLPNRPTRYRVVVLTSLSKLYPYWVPGQVPKALVVQ